MVSLKSGPESGWQALLDAFSLPVLTANGQMASDKDQNSNETKGRHPQTARIYFSCSSEGFGHSSRALALCQQLMQPQFLPQPFLADQLVVATYGIALKRLQALGLTTVEVNQEIKLVGKEGGFDVGQTILQNPSRALSFNQMVQQELELMKAHSATLVVADGRMAPVVAAAKLEIPCVVLANQSAFYPFFNHDSPLVKLLGLSFEWLMKFWLSSAEEIWVPDFPPPYTVSLANLSDSLPVKKRTRFVGPLVSPSLLQAPPAQLALKEGENQRPAVVVSLGGHAYRRPLLEALMEAARLLPYYRFEVLSAMVPETTPPDNVTLHGQVSNCLPFFKAAAVVVTQAGHSTAMELASVGTPAVIVPDYKQIEQENNAARMVELGAARCLTYPQLSPLTLAEAIEAVIQTPAYKEQAQILAEQAQVLQGPRYAATMLNELASRVIAY